MNRFMISLLDHVGTILMMILLMIIVVAMVRGATYVKSVEASDAGRPGRDYPLIWPDENHGNVCYFWNGQLDCQEIRR